MKLRPVYVRGVGAVTALGSTWRSSLPQLRAGRSAVGPVTRFDTTGFPCGVAAEISGGGASEDLRVSLMERACAEAWKGAWPEVCKGAAIELDPLRTGVFIGAESGRASFETIVRLAACSGPGPAFDHAVFGLQARSLAQQVQFEGVSPASVASFLAKKYGAQGPCQTLSLACSSSASALLEAARAIRLGVCDVAICGGVGADVDPLMLTGFGKVSALSAAGYSRPFDVRRDGFVVGEGAAAVILSSERGDAQVEIAGEGRSLDAYHLTAPDPQGVGAERAMRAALRQAGEVKVDYVQAHGTSTPLNDSVEAHALKRVLGASFEKTPVSSIKGALGHWIAGAGSLGFLCAWEAIQSGTILPTAGLEIPDPELNIHAVMGKAIEREVRLALVNSFAFGGANCSLVLRRVSPSGESRGQPHV